MLKAGVAVPMSKIRPREVCGINWLSLSWTISLQTAALLTAFTHSRPSFKPGADPLKPCCCFINEAHAMFWSWSSQTLLLLHQWSSRNVLHPLLSFQQSSQHPDSVSKSHSLCSSIRSNSSVRVLLWDCSNSDTSSCSTSSSLAISATSAVTSTNEVPNSANLKSSNWAGINLLKL